MRFLILLLCLGIAAGAPAAVYKWVDEDGNISFSDKPQPGAERIQEVKVQTYRAPPAPRAAPESAEPEQPDTGYAKVEIASPADDEAIRDNAGNVTVRVLLQPGLRIDAGHRLVLLIDGSPLSAGETNTSFTITNVDRGSHSVQANVVDGEGNVIASSDAVRFHLFRHSVRHPKAGGG